ncbi:MAG TPA: glycosyltransferase [Longimicrobium sp.]|nr:glycosyltransferase [Longimicrobium sp.]
MTALDLLSTTILAAMLAVALYNLATAPRLEAAGAPAARPYASVLVPARDEAENLRRTLPRLLALDYPRLEVLVLDDRSGDGTGSVAEEIGRRGGAPLRVLRGTEPPPGWTGKNWACHQLAEAASGEVLVFCDADVEAAPASIRRTVAALERHRAGAVTAIPRQRLDDWLQAAVVPVIVQLPVLSMLPLRLVPIVPSPSLSMANGQWLAFTRAAYDATGGHAAVRGEVVEDVALGRLVKARGHRLVVCIAATLLAVRMYAGPAAMRDGFRKNLYPLLGGRRGTFAAGLALLSIAWLYPFAAALRGTAAALVPLALLAAVRIAGVLLFRQGWRTGVLHPLGALAAAVLALQSWIGHERGRVSWKGRVVPSRIVPGADG